VEIDKRIPAEGRDKYEGAVQVDPVKQFTGHAQ